MGAPPLTHAPAATEYANSAEKVLLATTAYSVAWSLDRPTDTMSRNAPGTAAPLHAPPPAAAVQTVSPDAAPTYTSASEASAKSFQSARAPANSGAAGLTAAPVCTVGRTSRRYMADTHDALACMNHSAPLKACTRS